MNNKEKKDLKAAFDSMCYQLVNLHAHWNTFSELYMKTDERIELLQKTATNFFGIVQNMLLDYVELTLAKFGDPKTSKSKRGNKENLSLEQIYSIVAEEDPVMGKQLEVPVARYKEQCETIKAHRNRRIAHFDYQTHVEPKVNPLPDITRAAIESAIGELDRFLNQVSDLVETIETEISVQKTEHCFDPVMSDNVDAVVCFLAFGLRYDESRRAGKIPISDIDESKYCKA